MPGSSYPMKPDYGGGPRKGKMSREPRSKNIDNFTVKGMISKAAGQLDAETAALNAVSDTPPPKTPQTSPVGPSRAERAEAYKREQARRREIARSKVGPSATRSVGPGDQATRGRGSGTRRRP